MKPLTSLLLLVCVTLCNGQRLKAIWKETITTDAKRFIGRDHLGADYFIESTTLLKKEANQRWEYQNVPLGKITTVDLINPLKIVVFYQEYNTAVIVDNQLNEIQKFDFSQLDPSLVVSKIGMAGQNQLWLFNSANQKLLLFDSLKGTFREMPIPVQGKLKWIQTDFNFFHWIDEFNVWNTCDIFGKFTNSVTLPAYDALSIVDRNQVLFSQNAKLYRLDSRDNTIIEIEIVEKSLDHFDYKDQNLAIFTREQISFYTLKLP